MAVSNTVANRSHAAAFEPKNLRVLVVDSKGSSREQISDLLRDCCYQVAQSRTSKEALALLATKSAQGYEPAYDLILKEHEPPIADACRLLRQLAKSEHLRQVPVVVVSSQDDRELVSKCLNNGATDYLVKPLRNNELRNIWTRVWWWRRVSASRFGDVGPNTLYPDFDYERFPSSSSELQTICDDHEEPTSREGSATGNGNGAGNGSNGNGSNGSKEGNGTSRVEAKTIHGSNNGNGNGSSDEKNGNGNSATKNGNGNGSNHNGSNGNGASTTLVPEWPNSVVATAEGAKPSPLARKQAHMLIPTSKQGGQGGEDDTQTSKDMSAVHPWADVQERSGGRGAFTQYTSLVQRKRSAEAGPSAPSIAGGAKALNTHIAPAGDVKELLKHKAIARQQAARGPAAAPAKAPTLSTPGAPALTNPAPSEGTTPTQPKLSSSLPMPTLDPQLRAPFGLPDTSNPLLGPAAAHFPPLPSNVTNMLAATRPHFPMHLPGWMAPGGARSMPPSGVHPMHSHHHLPAGGFPGLPYPGLPVPVPPYMGHNGHNGHNAHHSLPQPTVSMSEHPTSSGHLPVSQPPNPYPHVPTPELYAEMLRRHQEVSRNMESFHHHPHAYNPHFMSMLMMAQSGAPLPPQLAAWMRPPAAPPQGTPHSLQAQPSSSTTTGIPHQLANPKPGTNAHHHHHHHHHSHPVNNLDSSQGGAAPRPREALVSPDPSAGDGVATSTGRCTKWLDTKRHRSAAVERYRKKRKNLKYSKKIRYECRQALAQTRPRVKGQFVKHGKSSQPAGKKEARNGMAMEEDEDDEYDEDEEEDEDMEEEEEEDEDEQEAESVDNQHPSAAGAAAHAGITGPSAPTNPEELHAVHGLFELQHGVQRGTSLEERARLRSQQLPPLIHPCSSVGSGGKNTRASGRRQSSSRQQSSGSAFQNVTPMNSFHSPSLPGHCLHYGGYRSSGLGSESGSNSPVRHTPGGKSTGHHRQR